MPETGTSDQSDLPTGPSAESESSEAAATDPSVTDTATGAGGDASGNGDDAQTSTYRLPGGGVRPAVWLLAILAALGICVFVPWYSRWFAGEGTGESVSLFGSGFLPVLPLFLTLLLATVWNPLIRLGGMAWLAARPAELMVIAALLYVPAGLTEGGLRKTWTSSLFLESGLRAKKQKEVLAEGPYAFSLPAEGDVRDAFTINKKIQSLLAEQPAGDERAAWSKSLLKARADYEQLVLTGDRVLSPDCMNQIQTLAEQGGDPSAVLREIDQVQLALQADLALFKGLNEGGQSVAAFSAGVADGAGPSPASRLTDPLINSSILIIACMVLVLGLGAMTGRQWTHNERLQHPLIQVPGALAEKKTLVNKLFWVGFGSVLFIWVYQLGGKMDIHPLPLLPVGQENDLVKMPSFYEQVGLGGIPSNEKWVYQNYWSAIKFFPYVIAIAFLLAADMSFSIWGGFFFGALIMGWMASMGLPVSFYKHARKTGGGGGALLAMTLVIFWLGRHHYWRLIKAAVGVGKAAEDPTGVLGARLVMASGLAVVLLIWGYTGPNFDGFLAGIFGLALSLAFIIVTARVVAESGLACFQSTSHMHELVYGLGMPWALPYRAMVMLTYLGGTVFYDTRQNLAGYTVQSQAMGERAGENHRGFFAALLLIVVVGAVVSLLVGLLCAWTGSNGLGAAAGGDAMVGGAALKNAATNAYKPAFLGMTERQLAVAGGFLLVFMVVGLRRIWSGCWLNPLGLVVAASWPIHLAWGSLMLGWAAKMVVLRYGGSALYSRLKPMAFGVILGDVSGYALLLISQTISKIAESPVVEIRAWP